MTLNSYFRIKTFKKILKVKHVRHRELRNLNKPEGALEAGDVPSARGGHRRQDPPLPLSGPPTHSLLP